MIFILPSFIAALLLNIPKWLEFKHVSSAANTSLGARLGNTSESEEADFWVDGVTPLRHDPDYIFYYTHITRLLCTGLIPFVYLACVNLSICYTINKSTKLQLPSRRTGGCGYTLCLHSGQESPSSRRAGHVTPVLTSDWSGVPQQPAPAAQHGHPEPRLGR